MKQAIKNIKDIKQSYYLPTPKTWRKIGDSFLTLGTTITSISAFTMPPWVTAIAAILTCIGKIITNFTK